MNARTKKVVRIAAIPFSLLLAGGYVAFRAGGCQAIGVKMDPVAAAPDATVTPATTDMMFSGSKSGAMFTPEEPRPERKAMLGGSKSMTIGQPEDFTPAPEPTSEPNAAPRKPTKHQPSQPQSR
jgi:hypothetical protein